MITNHLSLHKNNIISTLMYSLDHVWCCRAPRGVVLWGTFSLKPHFPEVTLQNRYDHARVLASSHHPMCLIATLAHKRIFRYELYPLDSMLGPSWAAPMEISAAIWIELLIWYGRAPAFRLRHSLVFGKLWSMRNKISFYKLLFHALD